MNPWNGSTPNPNTPGVGTLRQALHPMSKQEPAWRAVLVDLTRGEGKSCGGQDGSSQSTVTVDRQELKTQPNTEITEARDT
jgi:hypothetical protein